VYMVYGVARAALLGFFENGDDSGENDIAGPIVITDASADRVDDAFGPRSRGISPRGRH